MRSLKTHSKICVASYFGQRFKFNARGIVIEISIDCTRVAFFTESQSLALPNHMLVLSTGKAFHVKGWEVGVVSMPASAYKMQILAVKG